MIWICGCVAHAGWAVAFPDTRFVGDRLQASQLPMAATVKAIHAVSPNHGATVVCNG